MPLYEIAQRRDDEAQGALLSSLLSAGPDTELYVAERGPEVVGFVSVLLNHERSIGEVGLNAVDPAQAGQGVGTAMYTFALDRMREVGMKAAVVSTGGDPSHAPARRAYEKAGFLVAVPSVWMCRTL